jgi:hypothetical protein
MMCLDAKKKGMELNWIKDSKSKMARKMASNLNIVVCVCLEFVVGIKGNVMQPDLQSSSHHVRQR